MKAVAIVLVILLVVPGVEAVFDKVTPSNSVSVSPATLDARALIGGDPSATLARIEDVATAEDAQLPAAFVREIGLLPDARDLRVIEAGPIVGYTVDEDATVVLDQLVEHMESMGWTAVSLGDIDGATFIKSAGNCTWALVTCTQVGFATAVVVRCAFQ